MSGLSVAGGRITPSLRPRRSLRLSPERVEPVERGSWRGSAGVLLSGVGSWGADAWARAPVGLRPAIAATRPRASKHPRDEGRITSSPAQRASSAASGLWAHPEGSRARGPALLRRWVPAQVGSARARQPALAALHLGYDPGVWAPEQRGDVSAL